MGKKSSVITFNETALNILACKPRNKYRYSTDEVKAARKSINMLDWFDNSLLASSLNFYKSMVKLVISALNIEASSDRDRGKWQTKENHYGGQYDGIWYQLSGKVMIYLQCNYVGTKHTYSVVIEDADLHKKYQLNNVNYANLRKFLIQYRTRKQW